jgi:hypothetical protein
MSIISAAYFNDGIKNIPNIDKPSVSEMLTDLIAVSEKVYLTAVLGYPLYKAFIAGLAEVTPAAKWVALRDGKDFVYNGKTIRWNGFKDGTTFQSPIANYVMSRYLNDKSIVTSGAGETSSKFENANAESPLTKYVANWNEMVNANVVLYAYLTTSADYPEFDKNIDLSFFKLINMFGI